jgi:phosphoribosylaminoimidazolecarboxamide formyltransferase/IMP cyclohydrolase
MNALISVSNKESIVNFAKSITESGHSLISTGGTWATIQDAHLPVKQVSEITKYKEILDGRVKTLHPNIHGGILAKRDYKTHVSQLEELGIEFIDIVVVNLYPFVETVSSPNVSLSEGLENIDIGGPAMLRAAAKNFTDVIVVVDPCDYDWIGNKLINGELINLDERKKLARKAFQHVALYDTAIATWLDNGNLFKASEITVGFNKIEELRYGENPHQTGAVFANILGDGGIVKSEQLHGMPMSYTNYLDADSALTTVNSFSETACVVVKHTNPCGIAIDDDQVIAFQKAFNGDSVSAYGGIVGFNKKLEESTAMAMKGILFDIIIAPSYEPQALIILQKRKRTRVLKAHLPYGPLSHINIKSISGGALIQTNNDIDEDMKTWQIVSERSPTDKEMIDLIFAWRCLKHIKSNTIVLAKDNELVGMGAGQPNRLVSIHLALKIAADKSNDAALSSDAFMPFPDNIDIANTGGIKSIIQPGGSIRDSEVIKRANDFNMAMVFTGVRHFNH